MTDQNDWYRILSIARENAADDLAVSNKILEVYDVILRMNNEEAPTKDEVLEASNKLIEIAMELSEKSKDMNFAISKLMGAL